MWFYPFRRKTANGHGVALVVSRERGLIVSSLEACPAVQRVVLELITEIEFLERERPAKSVICSGIFETFYYLAVMTKDEMIRDSVVERGGVYSHQVVLICWDEKGERVDSRIMLSET